MNRIITLFASALLLNAVHSIAQPVILDGTNLAATGYSSPVMNGTATVAPGAGGASLTWNFSTVTMTNVGVYAIENPASTPVAASYPSGNYALSVTPTASSALYSYYIVSSSAMRELANSVTTTTGSGVNYTPGPRKILKFPFNYQDTFTSFYATSTTTGNDFFEYDGYGTLITPWATYTNVVRVKCTHTSTFGYDYNWYTLSPLLNVFSYSSIPNTYTGLSAVPTGTPSIGAEAYAITIAPNPFSDQTIVKINSAIQLKDAEIVITDVTGKVLRKVALSSSETELNKEDINPGMYFYTVLNNGSRIANGKLVIQ